MSSKYIILLLSLAILLNLLTSLTANDQVSQPDYEIIEEHGHDHYDGFVENAEESSENQIESDKVPNKNKKNKKSK